MKRSAASTKTVTMGKSTCLTLSALLLSLAILTMITANQANAFTFPQCDDSKVEARIFKDFRWADKHTWHRGLDIVSLDRVHEHRTVLHDGSIVSRRYCMAHANLSDGKRRPLYYMINDRGGFAGVTWKVTHCIVGLDPWKNHDGNCRAIR